MKYIAILSLLFLIGCGSGASYNPPAQPRIDDFILTEADFKQATQTYLRNGGGPMVSTYDIVMTDLNNDYLSEGLVMMNTPFNTWCNAAGCTLLIFEAKGQNIVLNSRIEPIRGPLFIEEAPYGWKSLIVRQDGMNRDARYIELKNTGNGYPAMTLNSLDYHGEILKSGRGIFY